MLNLHNKPLTKIISLILIQTFLFTGMLYPNPINNKDMGGIYNINRTLRLPLASSQQGREGGDKASATDFKRRFLNAAQQRRPVAGQPLAGVSLWETNEEGIVRIIIGAFEQIKATPVMDTETIEQILDPESGWWREFFTKSGSSLFDQAIPYIKRALEQERNKKTIAPALMADSAINILYRILQEVSQENEIKEIFEAAQTAITRPLDIQVFDKGVQIVQVELDNIIERSNDGEEIPVEILSEDYWQDVFGDRRRHDLFSQMWPFITVVFSEGISRYSSRGAKIIAKDFVELANTASLRHARVVKDESAWESDECQAFVAEVLNKAEPGSYTDAYTVLGLEQGAGLDKIHRAYRALSAAYYTESLGSRHIAIENINRAYQDLFVDSEKLEALERLLDYAASAEKLTTDNQRGIISLKFNSKIPAIGIDAEQIKTYLQKLVLVKSITDDNVNDALIADAEIVKDEAGLPQGIIINSQERGYDILFLEEGKIGQILYAVVKIFLMGEMGEFNIDEGIASEIALGAMRASSETKRFNIRAAIEKATSVAPPLGDFLPSPATMKGI